MDLAGNAVSHYATPEVFTVLAALFVAWIGWKTASKIGGLLKFVISGVSFAGLLATILLFTGLSGVGLGIGEWASRGGNDEAVKMEIADASIGMSDSDLADLLGQHQCNGSSEALIAILAYAENRDDAQREEAKLQSQYVQRSSPSDNLVILPVATTTPTPTPEPEYLLEASSPNDSMMSTQMAWLSLALGIGCLIASMYVIDSKNPKPKP